MAKGRAVPLAAWETRGAEGPLGVDVTRRTSTPLVGRERELDLLVSTLERVRAERSPQLVTLVGVPGIGKSRLVFELFRTVDEDERLVTWRQGRSFALRGRGDFLGARRDREGAGGDPGEPKRATRRGTSWVARLPP